MSDVEVHGQVHGQPPVRDEMPAAIVAAIICGALVAVLWAFAVLLLFGLVQGFGGSAAPWLLACVFAAGAGVAGTIGCARRWVWVRWAALLQSIVVTLALLASVSWMPFVPWVIGLFAVYAGLQFLPSAHRWYHPLPLWKRQEAAGLDS